MKYLSVGLAALFFLTSCTASEEPPSLVDQHVAALGGEAAIESLQSIRVSVEITEPGFTVRGDYRAARDDHMRIDIYDGETRVFTETLNGETGWQMFADGRVDDLSPGGEAILRQGITGNLFGLHEYAERGATVTAGEPERIEDVEYRTINILFANGHERRVYLDPETLLVARERSEYALHPDVNPDEDIFETLYTDYREVGGALRPFATQKINLRTGETAQTTRILNVEINPQLDPAQFERPDSGTTD